MTFAQAQEAIAGAQRFVAAVVSLIEGAD